MLFNYNKYSITLIRNLLLITFRKKIVYSKSANILLSIQKRITFIVDFIQLNNVLELNVKVLIQ